MSNSIRISDDTRNSRKDRNHLVSRYFRVDFPFVSHFILLFVAEYEKYPSSEHEPHCPLFEVKRNYTTVDSCSADHEKKFRGFHTVRNETTFQKFLRLAGPFNAKDLVDKYFDG